MGRSSVRSWAEAWPATPEWWGWAARRVRPTSAPALRLGGGLPACRHARCQGHGRTPCSPRTPAGRTLARSARRGALLPLPQHPPSPTLCCPYCQACPSSSVPWLSPRMGTQLGTGQKVPNCQMRRISPTCPGSETLRPSLGSSQVTPRAWEERQSLPLAPGEQCWPLAASSSFP